VTTWLIMRECTNTYMCVFVSFVGCCCARGGVIILLTSCWYVSVILTKDLFNHCWMCSLVGVLMYFYPSNRDHIFFFRTWKVINNIQLLLILIEYPYVFVHLI
jgi:hypothetical protein